MATGGGEHHYPPHASRHQPQSLESAIAQFRPEQQAAQSGRYQQQRSNPEPRVGAAAAGGNPPQQQQNRSPSQERMSRSYLPSWRSISTWNWQSPISLRRLRTASSDRSGITGTDRNPGPGTAAGLAGGFDQPGRRFQPAYRSWNEKDNYYKRYKE